MTNTHILNSAKPLPSTTDLAVANLILIGPRVQFSDCLCRVIQTEIEGCQLVRLDSIAELAAEAEAQRIGPQVVIIDDSLWETVDETLINGLRLDFGAVVAVAYRNCARVLVLTERHPIRGPISFLPMDLNIQSWLTIVRLLMTGYPFVPPELAISPVTGATTQPDAKAHPKADAAPSPIPARNKLTPRETEVLRLMAHGLQNKHIAERLALSEHTVKLHVHKVISKLGATNRTAAAMQFQSLAEG